MLFHSLRAHCNAPGGPGSIWMYLEGLVRATKVSVRFACSFRTDLHLADVEFSIIFRDCLRCFCVEGGFLFGLVSLIAMAMLSLYTQHPKSCVATPGCNDYVTHDTIIPAMPLIAPGDNMACILSDIMFMQCGFKGLHFLIRLRPSIECYHVSQCIGHTWTCTSCIRVSR